MSHKRLQIKVFQRQPSFSEATATESQEGNFKLRRVQGGGLRCSPRPQVRREDKINVKPGDIAAQRQAMKNGGGAATPAANVGRRAAGGSAVNRRLARQPPLQPDMNTDTFNWMLGAKQRWYTPMSDHLFEVLRLPLKPYLHDDQQYHMSFNRFEYMRALFEADGQDQYPAIGRFGWQSRPIGPDVRQEIDAEFKREGRNWAPFRAGWFGGQLDRFEAAQAAVNKMTAGLGWH
jgi:hypothetical protein